MVKIAWHRTGIYPMGGLLLHILISQVCHRFKPELQLRVQRTSGFFNTLLYSRPFGVQSQLTRKKLAFSMSGKVDGTATHMFLRAGVSSRLQHIICPRLKRYICNAWFTRFVEASCWARRGCCGMTGFSHCRIFWSTTWHGFSQVAAETHMQRHAAFRVPDITTDHLKRLQVIQIGPSCRKS